MKTGIKILLSFLIGFAIFISWLRFPLWRDVRFQTGFDNDVVVLPSGHQFKPGQWSDWPTDAPSLIQSPELGNDRPLLKQEGFENPVIIRSQTGEYPAEITSVGESGKALTWFIVPCLND